MNPSHPERDDASARLQGQARAWLVRLTSGEATTEDARAYKQWCAQSAEHARAMDEAKRLWQVSGAAASAMAKVARPPAQVPRARLQPGRRAFIGGALAAGVTGWLVVQPPGKLWPGLFDLTADYRTGTGEQRDLQLALAGHQVHVAMNTQTSLNALPRGAGIALSAGEAQVDAPAGAAFLVRVGEGDVRAATPAAAARFNVRLQNGQVCVTCLTGNVQVAYAGRVLQAGPAEQLTYGDGALAKTAAPDVARLAAWRQGVLVFDDVPLASMIEEINRYRRGQIILANQDLGRRRVQAQVRLDQLADVVGLIQTGYGARVTTLPAGIVVLS